ncbi:MAG: hypothetical protein SX243_07915 [Acidobacteriota bacterium]|nr:hypothetical protein [Acidobacteriota bacterium]
MKTLTIRFALLAVLAAGLMLWVAPPADAAYQNCRQVCDYVPPTDNCTCMPEYYHTTCGSFLVWGCGLQPLASEASQAQSVAVEVAPQVVESQEVGQPAEAETPVATD